jgi:hypothetical protein
MLWEGSSIKSNHEMDSSLMQDYVLKWIWTKGFHKQYNSSWMGGLTSKRWIMNNSHLSANIVMNTTTLPKNTLRRPRSVQKTRPMSSGNKQNEEKKMANKAGNPQQERKRNSILAK